MPQSKKPDVGREGWIEPIEPELILRGDERAWPLLRPLNDSIEIVHIDRRAVEGEDLDALAETIGAREIQLRAVRYLP